MTVWFYDFSGDRHKLTELAGLLGEQRYRYCSEMKNEGSALHSAYAFLLLRYALKNQYGILTVPELTFNEHGKPFLKDFPDIYFSISHCAKRVICAVSSKPVGADIQNVRRLKSSAERHFLTEDERLHASEFTDPDEHSKLLCRYWCIKESYSKMTGKGFGEGFTKISVEELLSSGRAVCTEKDGFFISVCE